MPDATQCAAFARFGVRPTINACGIYTDLGGTCLSPSVWAGIAALNDYYVDMPALLDATGRMIATLVDAPAARITPGASAALALSAAACMAGMDGEAWERLPDTRGLRSRIVMHHRQRVRYKYARCAALSGCTVVDAGDTEGTSADQLRAALDANVAAVLYAAHLESDPHTSTLDETALIARAAGVPLIVDAAYMNFPPPLMRTYMRRGADLVCFSAKYYWGPNAGGFVCGRADLIDAVAGLDFTRFESGQYQTFGRAFKMGRFEIAATVLALEEWFAMDHDARYARYAYQVDRLRQRLEGVPGLTLSALYFTMEEELAPSPINCLHIAVDPASEISAPTLTRALAESTPSIRVIGGERTITVVMDTVREGEELQIGEAIAKILRSAT